VLLLSLPCNSGLRLISSCFHCVQGDGKGGDLGPLKVALFREGGWEASQVVTRIGAWDMSFEYQLTLWFLQRALALGFLRLMVIDSKPQASG